MQAVIEEANFRQQMEKYLSLLEYYSKTQNLVAKGDLARFWQHVEDSVSVIKYITCPSRIADVGSGAGFPGIPLAVALPDCVFYLFELRRKRATFLKSCTEYLGLSNVHVIQGNSKTLGRKKPYAFSFDYCTARAVAPPPRVFTYMIPLLKPGALGIVMTTDRIASRIRELSYKQRKMLRELTILANPTSLRDHGVVILFRPSEDTQVAINGKSSDNY
jgi:16S rRNA (guanine527-N7)-methyltransferase